MQLEDQFGNPLGDETVAATILRGEATLTSGLFINTDPCGRAHFTLAVDEEFPRCATRAF
ncbi:hypothetical protein C2W62_02160 [Candidatus Entotheonella serta]|nr:hypothetical protein C2W62_02160 [Candidatus Entotheonella serta]